MTRFQRPCIDCGVLARGSRCPQHQQAYEARKEARLTPAQRAARSEKKKRLYNSNYRKQAARVRATATHCHLCGGGYRPGDPWEADHLIPGDPNSPLAPAHRSCNASRGNKPLN